MATPISRGKTLEIAGGAPGRRTGPGGPALATTSRTMLPRLLLLTVASVCLGGCSLALGGLGEVDAGQQSPEPDEASTTPQAEAGSSAEAATPQAADSGGAKPSGDGGPDGAVEAAPAEAATPDPGEGDDGGGGDQSPGKGKGS
jgi:hypothetical protein